MPSGQIVHGTRSMNALGQFVFWQNIPTHLQARWIRALAANHSPGVWVALESEIPTWRTELGWEVPDYGSASVAVGFSPDMARKIIREAGPHAVHVFSGLGAYPAVHSAFVACIGAGRRVGLMSECSPANRGIVGCARDLIGKLRYLRFGKRAEFVLAIGEAGPAWFQNLGFAAHLTFEFAYFPPEPPFGERHSGEMWPSGGVRLLYIGQLIRRKGIDCLLQAVSELGNADWSLGLIGTGREEREMKALAEKLHVASRVQFCGAMANAEAMAVLNRADILILPSRFDGYGAVVNEALLRGVPVICSDQCGAQQAVKVDPSMGTVYSSIKSLQAALESWISRKRRTGERTRKVRDLAAACLHPEVGAEYFVEIIEHVYHGRPRPAPPWRKRQIECRETTA